MVNIVLYFVGAAILAQIYPAVDMTVGVIGLSFIINHKAAVIAAPIYGYLSIYVLGFGHYLMSDFDYFLSMLSLSLFAFVTYCILRIRDRFFFLRRVKRKTLFIGLMSLLIWKMSLVYILITRYPDLQVQRDIIDYEMVDFLVKLAGIGALGVYLWISEAGHRLKIFFDGMNEAALETAVAQHKIHREERDA